MFADLISLDNPADEFWNVPSGDTNNTYSPLVELAPGSDCVNDVGTPLISEPEGMNTNILSDAGEPPIVNAPKSSSTVSTLLPLELPLKVAVKLEP